YIFCILGISLLLICQFDKLNIYIKFVFMIILMGIICISFTSLKLNKKKMNAIGIILSVFIYFDLFISMIIIGNHLVIKVSNILELISSIYIFYKVFDNNIKNKRAEIKEKLHESNNKLHEYKEKLKLNKNITQIINESIEKKQTLLQIISGDYERCTFIIDRDGYILNEDNSFTKMWEDYTWYKYKIDLNLFLEKSIKNSDDFINSLVKAKDGIRVENELKSKDGRLFKCIYAPFMISNQNMGVICAMSDITYKKNSEIKIKENNLKYRKIVDTIPYTILISDEENILYNNNKNRNIDFYNKDIKNIILEKSTKGELYYTQKNIGELCLNIDRVEFYDEEVKKSLVVVRDITDYKKLLKDVEYSKEKYESLVNVIPEGIYVSDYESRNINYSNKVFENLIDKEKFDFINIKNDKEDSFINLSDSNENISFKREVIRNKKGQDVNIEWGEMLIEINKKLNRVGVVRDITEQVNAEIIEREIEAKKKENKIKSEFFVNISHELKTPLNVITSSNQLLEIMNKDYINKNPNSEISKSIEIVKKHTYMLMGLIDNIMELAKLESQFHESDRDYYNIVSVVEDICEEFNKYISINDIDILFDTDEEERIANVDPDDMEKIILTLLSMVIRYSYKNSTILVNLTSFKSKTIITIKNEGSYDYNRYINDQERRSLDIGVTVAKSIIELYNGSVNIKVGSNKDMEINIEMEINEEIQDYKNRVKLSGDNFIYTEYLRMCNF
ncbi:MAG: histidine kinase dimerization/phospho-acceptor domain-containing protein, partial [Romboutsia sp.]|uniref:PAS domain-containing sensor histidine kinase n=1 Tax=Romboutsia sp. TaxID=1965302 RepID=UPI003F3AC67F